MKSERKGKTLGTLGTILGLIAFGVGLLHFTFGPIEEPKPVESVGPYTIIHYPDAPAGSFEVSSGNESIFVRHGGDAAIMHPKFKVPLVMVRDTNHDGIPDRLDYDVLDSKGNLVSSASDYNYDGQIDRRIVVESRGDNKPPIKSYVWLQDEWKEMRNFGRDSDGLLIRKIKISNEWKRIDISAYPFKLGD
ncbi:MAG: hypothetical protein JAY90_19640 [Candidatus Thiodiazotropha lotti]|nr:hypothetical protein [Candidatus Thiodiazotropha lotti]